MKKLLTLFILVSFSSFAQNDTIALSNEVIKYYNDITDSTPDIAITKKGIESAEQLYDLKHDKTKLSIVLGTMYYIYGTQYAVKHEGSGFKHKGYIDATAQKEALRMAKKHYEYFVANTKVKDDMYRSAQNGILRIDKKINEL